MTSELNVRNVVAASRFIFSPTHIPASLLSGDWLVFWDGASKRVMGSIKDAVFKKQKTIYIIYTNIIYI